MAISRSSGDAAGPCRRDAAVAWRPAALLSQQPGLSRGGRAAGGGDRRTVRAPSGARHVARGQRVRLSRAGVVLRRIGTGVSRLAEGTIRVDRRPQSGMGDGFLVAALFGLGGDHPSSANPTWPNPSQQLDYMRFSSDALLECYELEHKVLSRL